MMLVMLLWVYIHTVCDNQVILCSYFSQSALRKGCPNRNPFWCIQSIISFVILYETSWNFVIMFGYENYSSDKNMESK
jgi:hypothetical protein